MKEEIIKNLLNYREHLYSQVNWGKSSSYEERYSWWSCLCHNFMGVLDYVQLYHDIKFEDIDPIFLEFREKSKEMLDI